MAGHILHGASPCDFTRATSTQRVQVPNLRSLVPKTIKGRFLGTRVLKYRVLGPSVSSYGGRHHPLRLEAEQLKSWTAACGLLS